MRESLSQDAIEQARKHFMEEVEADRDENAWEALQPLLRAQAHQEDVALTLVELVDSGYLPRDRSLEVLEGVHQAHRANELLLGMLGNALERASDIDMLNAPPPQSELFAAVVDELAAMAAKV
ncbi:MAG TPA: hypothetical protein VFO35_05360, partial [Steroidobacteraceae bacterium]|nr:hypothetical protein [Steroidobacteraceae bacterium]